MALVVFLRGVNVGGHKTFRPSVLVRELSAYDAVNIGAAGTFVIRKPVAQARIREELVRMLPFATEIAICRGKEILDLVSQNPFADQQPDSVRFVTILCRRPRLKPSLPMSVPSSGMWMLRILATEGRFILGMYRRHPKAISSFGVIDRFFGVPVTSRSWNTIVAIARVLRRD